MRESRKEALLESFPEVPFRTKFVMSDGKKTQNFCVFLARNNILYVRCFHRYATGKLEERQRYVFAEDGCVRYGESNGKWTVRRDFREPVFYLSGFGYRNDSYSVLGKANIHQTWLKYSAGDLYEGQYVMLYLKYWIKHPKAEYLVKTGYSWLIENDIKGGAFGIDWQSNNVLKMLHLSRAEFKALQGKERRYFDIINWKKMYPELSPEEIFEYCDFFGYTFGSLGRIKEKTGLSIRQIYNYFQNNNIRIYDYEDYIRECEILKYDIKNNRISRPKDFFKTHERTSSIIKYKKKQESLESFERLKPERKFLEFASGNLFIRQPESFDEIVAEGRELSHCVGGYAERHSIGKLHIMFIRTADKPDIPYYTVEIDTQGNIIQIRGYKNGDMTEEVREFSELYREYLSKIFNKKEQKAV